MLPTGPTTTEQGWIPFMLSTGITDGYPRWQDSNYRILPSASTCHTAAFYRPSHEGLTCNTGIFRSA